jgi:transcriptional regulator with XRE-family HTH domain
MLKITLASARVNAGLSQKEVCEKLKISNTTLCAWETYKSYPNIRHVNALCELYGVSLDNLKFLPNNPL